jgi:PIN domain nuclease of toxin-antitoxin system
MAVVLYLEDRKLPQKIKTCFLEAEQNQAQIFIPAITLAEISYLAEKGHIAATLEAVAQLLRQYAGFQIKPLSFEIVTTSFQITDIPELQDRLIAGTAKYLDIVLLTNDPVIEKSAFVKTLWK